MNKTKQIRKLTIVVLLLVVALCLALAACKVNTPTVVTFDANYVGGATQKQTVENGKLTPPTLEPRDGFLFDDWYLDKNCTEKLTDTHSPKNGEVYYAGWIALPKLLTASVARQYFVGDVLTKEDVTVTVIYHDDTDKVLSASDFSADLSAVTQGAGRRSVLVSYSEHSIELSCTLTVEVIVPNLVSISATYVGGKIFIGGTISEEDFTVTGTYANNTTQPITDFTVRDFNSVTAGKKTVTITCGNVSTTIDVEVFIAQVIAISARYDGTVYVGRRLDESKIIVTVSYEDGRTEQTSNYALGTFSSEEAGVKTVSISYADNTSVRSEFPVTVIKALPVSISAKYNGKVAVGAQLDPDKFTVTVTFQDDAMAPVSQFTTSGFASDKAGQVTVTVSCTVDGVPLSTQCVVEVVVAKLLGISARYDGDPVLIGAQLDKSKIIVTASYDLLPDRTVTNFQVEGFSSTTLGEKQVKVIYSENNVTKEASVTVHVVKSVLKRITVQTSGELWVLYGGKLDHSLLTVTAIYADDSSEVITKFSDNLITTTAGEKTVTISYTESGVTKTTTITVNVYAPLKSISARYTGDDLTVGDSLNIKDIEVFATYADGTSHAITSFDVGAFSSAVAGTQEVQISYTELNPVTKLNVTESTTVEIVVVDSYVAVSGNFSVHFLELGNKYVGDSVYIKAGDIDILIDAGSRKDSAPTITNYVNQYCKDGILEYVIATHAHQDHIAGFVGSSNKGIFDSFVCENIIEFARTDVTSQIYRDYCTKRNAEVAAGANVFTALECYNNSKEGAQRVYDLMGDGSITMEILYQEFYENKAGKENDYSVCVMFHQGENHYLFTGDLEKAGEESLVKNNPDMPEVVLYKGGHHGSSTSSNDVLLETIKPQYICICTCAGSDEYTDNSVNTFPTQETINRIAKYTDRVYVTTLGQVSNAGGTWVQGTASMNGNIVFSCINGTISVACSNNNLKLKDTDWFKANRTCPSYWREGTKTPSMYHD